MAVFYRASFIWKTINPGSGKRGVCYSNDQPRSGRRHGKDTGEPFDGSTDAGSRIFDKNKDNFASALGSLMLALASAMKTTMG